MDNYHWGMWGAVATTSTTLRSTCPPAGEPSWEEQAFARDAAGHLGAGCVWPPRSYTCTFCRREFRSAQALGGHMNVHRRDRARLRQCASPPDHQVQTQPTSPHDRQHLQPDNLYRAGAATLLSSPRSPKDQQAMISSTSPSYISTIIKESKNKVFISMSADATVTEAAESGDEEGRTKRRRVDQPPAVALPFFLRPPASCERADGDAKVPKAIPSPSPSGSLNLVGRQEVDLELRLGTSTPKVA